MRAPETLARPAGSVELPTIRPGVDRVPTRCERCSSTWLGYEEPLGPQQRGMLWCQQCSRSICWLATPLPRRRARAAGRLPPAPVSAPGRSPIRTDAFRRTDGCGRACTSEHGHDAAAHERYGADAVHAAIAARASGDVVTGPLLVQLGPARVFVGAVELAIAAAEYRLLAALADRLGELCPHADLIAAVWGTGWSVAMDDGGHLLRTYVGRLRGRLGVAASLLETEIGRGYRLADAPLC